MKRTNEMIFQSIQENGFITKSDLQLLKNRSNKEQKDLFNYALLDLVNNGYGIPVTEEQGLQGLKYLKRFIRKGIYGSRELNILESATANDFTFRGFYNAGGYCKNFQPIYELNGMEYVSLVEPYICG